MNSSNKTRDLVRNALEVEINKRISISILDRFGDKHYMFQRQFQDTKKSLENFEAQKHIYNLEDSICSVEKKLEEKKKELHILSRFNKKKINEAEILLEKVTELKEDIQSELEFINNHPQISEIGHDEEAESCRDQEADKEATIIQWRLDAIPQIPSN